MRLFQKSFVIIVALGALLAGRHVLAAPGKVVPKAPLPPKAGVKTPGVQIPFAGVTADATLPAPDKPAWLYVAGEAPPAAAPAADPGAGRGRGGRGGGGGAAAAGGGGRGGRGGGGGGNAGRGGGAAASFLFIPTKDGFEKISTKDNKAGDAITGLQKPCGGVVTAFGSMWVPTCGDGALQRLDPKTSKVTATIKSGAADIRGSIAASADSIWLFTDNKQTLSRIDPEQNAVVAELRVPVGCNNLTFGETSLWLECTEQNKILRINPATNVIDKRIDVTGHPVSLLVGEGSVWVLGSKEGKIDRIDPKTDKITKTIDLAVPGAEGRMAFGDGFLWVTMTGFPVTRVDTTAETVMQQFWGEGGGSIVTTAGAIWLTNLTGPAAGTITRIDPKLLLATLAE